MCFLNELLSWAHWIQINLTFVAIRRRLEGPPAISQRFTQTGQFQFFSSHLAGALVPNWTEKKRIYTLLRSHRSGGPEWKATSRKTSFVLFSDLFSAQSKNKSYAGRKYQFLKQEGPEVMTILSLSMACWSFSRFAEFITVVGLHVWAVYSSRRILWKKTKRKAGSFDFCFQKLKRCLSKGLAIWSSGNSRFVFQGVYSFTGALTWQISVT